MNNELYKINCLTNLHVGSGDSNYGIIDNLVQRDLLTEFPVIHESSLKGSIKEFFVHSVRSEGHIPTKEAQKDSKIKSIFGNENGQGEYRFYAGHLLLFPVRTNKIPYLMATCPQILKEFCELSRVMGLNNVPNLESLSKVQVETKHPLVFDKDLVNYVIEYPDFKAIQGNGKIPNFLGNAQNFVLLSDEDFKAVCGKNKLPVIARNHLEDGKSTNLWYEEIVPRKSVFYCFIGQTSSESNFFCSKMKEPMQLGANASTGYGLVTFEKTTLS